MRTKGIIILSLLLISVSSCKNQKDTTKDSTIDTPLVEEEIRDYYGEGYQKAYIRYFAENIEECSYLLQLEGEGVLEPPTLDESFKTDRQKVWIKFVRQRRLSKCGEATPIQLYDIQKRKD